MSDAADPASDHPAGFPGDNMLGKLLMERRAQLLGECN